MIYPIIDKEQKGLPGRKKRDNFFYYFGQKEETREAVKGFVLSCCRRGGS